MKRFALLVSASCFIGGAYAQLPPDLATRVSLNNQHVDLRLVYQPAADSNHLALVIRDGDTGTTYNSTNVVLTVPDAAKVSLPPGFEVFGNEGDPLWILPQSQNPLLLYMGFSAEGIPSGSFNSPAAIFLTSIQGPGNLFLWQFDGLSGMRLVMNSRDGLSPEDSTRPITGSHEHFNWGFTTKGLYQVTFQASARRPGDTNDITSMPTTFLFAVEPLPVLPASPWQVWQAVHWPNTTDTQIIGPEADPDNDGAGNLLEFTADTNPRLSISQPRLMLNIITAPNQASRTAELSLVGRSDASSLVDFRFEASSELRWSSPVLMDSLPPLPIVEIPSEGGLTLWRAAEPIPHSLDMFRIYRVGVRLK